MKTTIKYYSFRCSAVILQLCEPLQQSTTYLQVCSVKRSAQ